MPAPNGQGTVVASGNGFAGLRIFEAPGAAAVSTVNGLVGWQNAQNGLRLYGGGRVKVRNSVFLANVLNGVYVTGSDGTDAGNDLSQIDLGSVSDAGRNVLQAAVGSMPDLAGLCVGMSTGRGLLTLVGARQRVRGPDRLHGLDGGHRAVGGVRRVRRSRRRPGGGHDRHRRRRELPVARAKAQLPVSAGQGSAPAAIQARMRAIAAFGIHLRGGM